jgi:hypothetical protein
MATKPFDCPFCGETWFICRGKKVPTCDCGFRLAKRPEGGDQGEFVLFLQLCRLDEEGISLDIDELREVHNWETLTG